ncbi:hypothetical protein DRF65_05705 [Chryseobacterium pennae]|uniref:Uncharacterized protein n=1 Tax=Chryseobacterium pennae TaxID=2258962 RepID=A0A3D9CCS2_9FLAO|nr:MULTISPECIES: hypothetical protein [Chryseobacterium]MCS4301390.1 hypothetical protein [Chryseobacterium sp. BIGb0232]REC63587.1 hypothetical protein DRF65_05705 [Chryseobacterium pennae]ROS19752.1 hypothetical protein EDF65_0445 [Chryseobacterium nakagawai]
MDLKNYIITHHKINFNDPQYNNLQNLLNSDFNHLKTLDSFLNELLYLKKHWNNIQLRDTFIETRLGGYWDWEGLEAHNVSGNWFTVIAFDDLNGYVNADTQVFYLENEILIQESVVEMPLEEFIEVLQQWKHILSE